MINWQKLFGGRIATSVQPLPTPPGTTDVVLNMNYGQKFTKTFKGEPGVTSYDVASRWVRESGNFFEIGGGKFANVQDIRDITLVRKP